MKIEEEKQPAYQTRRVSTERKRTASTFLRASPFLRDEVQSTNKKRRKDNLNENKDDETTVIDLTVAENKKEQGGDEVNKTNDQLLVVPLKELQEICTVRLNNSDLEIVCDALKKLYDYCQTDQTNFNASLCREDIRKNHLIPFITCAMCRFVDDKDIWRTGLGLLITLCVKVSDSLTVESVAAIMNVAIIALQEYPGKAIIQNRACLVLSNIFCFRKFHLSTIRMISKNMSVLDLIINAMKYHPNVMKVQERGCNALYRYYNIMDDRKSMEAQTCLGSLTNAMNYESCRKQAAKLMRLLSTQIESRK